ncbi:MAG: hypothetical protein ACOCW4_02865, partial [bacterium]
MFYCICFTRCVLGIFGMWMLLSSNSFAQQTDQPYGSYVYEDEKITLQLGAPNVYTLFKMEQDRRTGAVTSRELSRGTFDLKNQTLLLQEYPTRKEMKLRIDAPLVLQVVDMKGIKASEQLYAWRVEDAEGQTRMEGSWKRGKKHGTWI